MEDSKTSEKEAREYAESITNTVREPLIVLDDDLKVVTASRSFYDTFKVSPEETEGQPIYDLGNKQLDIPGLRQLLETLLPQKTTLDDYEVKHEFADFGSRTMLLNAREILRKSGKERLILLAIEDITERKQAEEALRESEEKYRNLVEGLNDAVYRMALPEGRYEYFSSSAEDVFGYTSEEFINNPLLIQRIMHPDSAGYFEDKWKELSEGNVQERYEYKIIDPAGNERWIVQSNKAIFDDSGSIKAIEGFCRNITEYKKAEKSLIESEALFRGMFKQHNAVMLLIDPNTGQIVEANQAAAQYYGYPLENLMQMKIQQLNVLPPAEVSKKMGSAVNEQVNIFEFQHLLANGQIRDVEVHSTPLTIQNQTLLFSIISDITVRKQAENDLRKRESHFRTLINIIPDLIWLKDADGVYLSCNEGFERFCGASKSDILGKTDYDLVDEELADFFREHDRKAMAVGGPNRNEEQITFADDGHKAFFETIKTPMFDTDGKLIGILGIGRDITERKQAETYREMGQEILQILNEPGDLQESIQRALAVLKTRTGVDAVGLRLKEGEDFPYFSQNGFSKDFLLTENTLVERGKDGGVCRDKDGNVRLECTCGLVISGKTDPSNPLFTKGGSSWANDSFPLLDLPSDKDPRLHPRNNCIHQGYASVALIPIRIQYQMYSRETCIRHGFRSMAQVPVRTSDQIVGLVQLNDKRKDRFTLETIEILEGIAAHVGSALMRKWAEAEQEKLQSQLNQVQKMESVGRLAGGVAHDFNNKLSIINGYAELAMETIDSSDPLQETIQEIYTAGQQSAGIVRQLLAFARQQTISPVQLDLNDTISSMLKMLQRLIGENINLEWHPGKNLWSVKIDPSQVDQIMANLAVNARDAISDVGKLTIETDNIVVDEDYCRNNPEAVPGRYVMLAVTDDGCGIEEEIREQLFDPYFTTKEVGKGTGLGLPTIYGIVKQNKGFINEYSEPGEGTTFKLYFPSHEETKLSLYSAKEPAGQIPTGTETVLVVEDEKTVLQMSKQMLERLGYTVETAGNPAEALQLSQEQKGTINLLITDVIMPEMNGRDLSSQLLKSHPDLKTLYMSGYTADVIAHHGVLDEGVEFIQKPFSLKDLALKVREVLEQV